MYVFSFEVNAVYYNYSTESGSFVRAKGVVVMFFVPEPLGPRQNILVVALHNQN